MQRPGCVDMQRLRAQAPRQHTRVVHLGMRTQAAHRGSALDHMPKEHEIGAALGLTDQID